MVGAAAQRLSARTAARWSAPLSSGPSRAAPGTCCCPPGRRWRPRSPCTGRRDSPGYPNATGVPRRVSRSSRTACACAGDAIITTARGRTIAHLAVLEGGGLPTSADVTFGLEATQPDGSPEIAMSYPPVTRPGLLGRLARTCHRHRLLTLSGWIAIVAFLVIMLMRFCAPASNDFTATDTGTKLINQHFPQQSGDSLTLAIRSAQPIAAPAVRERLTATLTRFGHAARIAAGRSPYLRPGQISANGHIAFATIHFDVTPANVPGSDAKWLMNEATAASGGGVSFYLGGDVVDLAETPSGGSSQRIAVFAAAIGLLISFGSLLAMSLPIVTALFGIASGLSLIALLGYLIPAPSFAPIIASLIGLGVGVDYALFIVTRFREALRGGAAPESAIVTAMSTAGRAVLFAGTTVIVAILGLLVLRQPLMNGVAVAASATVACVLLGSLTLLPALLCFTGTPLPQSSKPARCNRRGCAGPPPAGAPPR